MLFVRTQGIYSRLKLLVFLVVFFLQLGNTIAKVLDLSVAQHVIVLLVLVHILNGVVKQFFNNLPFLQALLFGNSAHLQQHRNHHFLLVLQRLG